MQFMITFAFCYFPTSFDFLWKVAAFCGAILFIATLLLLLQRRSLRYFGHNILMSVTLLGSILSFIIAFFASKNYLICAGVPNASADLIRQAEENYNTLMLFMGLVAILCLLTFALVLINLYVSTELHFARQKLRR